MTTARRPMTPRQQEVYEFVWLFRERHGYCCTIREIGDHFGWSLNGTVSHLRAIRRKQWLTWEPGQSRTIRPAEASNA